MKQDTRLMGFLTWRGLFEYAEKKLRRMVAFALVVTIISITFTQLGFTAVRLPYDFTYFIVLLLLPVTIASLLLGARTGTVVGLVAGITIYCHSLVIPLNYYEVVLINPFTSIVMFTIMGLLAGVLFSIVLRNQQLTSTSRLVRLVVVCCVLSWVYSLGFALVAAILRQTGALEALRVTNATTLGSQIGSLSLQAWTDAACMSICCVLSEVSVQRARRMTDDIGLRTLFETWLFYLIAVVFMAVAAISFATITLKELQSADAAIRSEANYLCLQLEDYRHAGNTHTDLLNGYTMEQTGMVSIMRDGVILMSDNSLFPVSKRMEDIVNPETLAAIKRSLQTGKLQRIVFKSTGTMSNDLPDVEDEPIFAFLLAMQKDDFVVTIIQPSSMVFADRRGVMSNVGLMTLVLSVTVFVLVSRLLDSVVMRRVDETDEVLRRITDGDLEARAVVQGAREFKSLSTNINQTVDTLKGWIAEAESRIDAELAAARAIQEAALPRTFPLFPHINKFDVYASMETAREVGGDFYDFFLIGPSDDHVGKVAFIIADVSGKGIPAALFMMKAKTLLRECMERDVPLDEAVTNTNNILCEGNESMMFVTAWIGVLDYAQMTVTYINAGHNIPLLWSKNEGWQWLRQRSGIPLGVATGLPYTTYTLSCQPGDVFLLYTDGVTEAMDGEKNLYGEERLEALLQPVTSPQPRDLLQIVHEDVAEYTQGTKQSDDITMAALRIC